MCGFILGALGGLAAVAVASRLRGRCGGGGCGGHHGFRRFGHHGFGPGRAFWMMRELDLSRDQKREVGELFLRVKEKVSALRMRSFVGIDALVDAVSAPEFDRAAVEQAAAQHAEAVGAVRQELVDSLAKLHATLSPTQRERLRSMVGGAWRGASEGPYR
jgi:Spy/CpxP family protein refolding chaperone